MHIPVVLLLFFKVMALIIIESIIFVLLYIESQAITLISSFNTYCIKCGDTPGNCGSSEQTFDCIYDSIFNDGFNIGTNYALAYVGAVFVHFSLLYTFNLEYSQKSIAYKLHINTIITVFTIIELIVVVSSIQTFENLLNSILSGNVNIDDNFLKQIFGVQMYSLLLVVTCVQYILKVLMLISSAFVYYRIEAPKFYHFKG